MRRHAHLTLAEREDIMVLRREGGRITEIAAAIGRNKSTVSRELARNSCQRSYRASTAQARYERRRKACRRSRILDDEKIFSLVRDKFLKERRSPEQIEGRLALELGASPVSDSTIYRGIAQGRFDGCIGGRKASRRLRRKGKRRRAPGAERRGRIKVSREIAERPEEAGARTRLGRIPWWVRPAARARSPTWTEEAATSWAARPPGRRRRRSTGHDRLAGGHAAGYRDARPRQGVRGPRRGDGGPGRRVLLRAAAPSLAARLQRECERPAARVLPEGQACRRIRRQAGAEGVR